MIELKNVSLQFNHNILFENVNLKFLDGNCYGLIGANGAGKSTFLKILTGQQETTTGEIIKPKDGRISFLEQDHYKYDDYKVLDTTIMGNDRLWDIMQKRNEIYSKSNFSEEDGIIAAKLEEEFQDMDGYNSEYNAKVLLNNLGISEEYHDKLMKDIDIKLKIKVMLAKALFDNPEILLLDEPTNGLDIEAINWLEEFLIEYTKTIIVVSHDRYFLNKVVTHICDIDFHKITMYVGNYDFWYETSTMLQRQAKESNKKKEEKIKELESFIARFSANASKSKQATSRKKLLDKITLEEIIPSSRKYPYIDFKIEKNIGNDILKVENLTKSIDNIKIINKISFTINKGDKICLICENSQTKTLLFDILSGKEKYDKGTIEYGKTINMSYLPQDNTDFFKTDDNILEWLEKYGEVKDVQEVRGFLGRMLFSNDDVFKKVNILSGGEKARCMLSKIMREEPNFLLLDEPTNHLDLESITSLNKGLLNFKGSLIFTSRDYELNRTVTNRVIEIREDGTIYDKSCTYEEYLQLKK